MIHDHLSILHRIERTAVRDVLREFSHVVTTLATTISEIFTLGHLSPPSINHDPLTIMAYIQIEFGFVVCVTSAAHATTELEESREHLFHVPTTHLCTICSTIGVLFGNLGQGAMMEFVTDPCHIITMDRVAVSVDFTKEIVGFKYFSRHSVNGSFIKKNPVLTLSILLIGSNLLLRCNPFIRLPVVGSNPCFIPVAICRTGQPLKEVS